MVEAMKRTAVGADGGSHEKDRGGSGRGRGRKYGHGRGSNHPGRGATGGSSNGSRVRRNHNKEVKVVTSNFPAMHKVCGAARYKVHKPGCDCPKMERQVRPFISLNNADERVDSGVHATGTNAGLNYRSSSQQLNGLVVVPDTKSIPSVYLCLGTGSDEFSRDSLSKELKLKEEIFAPLFSAGDEQEQTASFKVSCAACLLKDEPNGFACVSSSSSQTVDFARDMARHQAEEKRQEGPLHADHAHHICTLPRQMIWQLHDRARTREQKRTATREIMEHMSKQGVPIDMSGTVDNVEIGHHMFSLLHITKNDTDARTAHWLILVYDDTSKSKNPCWTIDLPGGKRHLGETTFDGTTRETEEEMSLTIDKDWILKGKPMRQVGKKDDINGYYLIAPPTELLARSLTENSFWRTPGFCTDPISEVKT
eukprot:CAMPEP_0194397592 /NCGR_PEP_ID=MMETSP0174-20130528/125631_1 /TAXON_ID=216777 /ORGANISM="Proboscia alata, Strain PI-D3" /LENGTH=423 /DNA_ID=CAMNT_0039193789 /DNA_START=271 /DNA_END=1542 /DNA_ORIENTATION=-